MPFGKNEAGDTPPLKRILINACSSRNEQYLVFSNSKSADSQLSLSSYEVNQIGELAWFTSRKSFILCPDFAGFIYINYQALH